ncbi:hypothetical protein ACFGWM_03450 [Pasteurella multocida]
MRKLITVTACMLFSATTIANSNTIFSCTTTEGKGLNIKSTGNDYIFTYDKISFKSPIKNVMENEGTEIAGGSGFTTYSLNFNHNEYSYSVGYIEPKGNSKELIEPGGSITRNGTFVDIMECNRKKPIHINFDKKIMRKTGFAK